MERKETMHSVNKRVVNKVNFEKVITRRGGWDWVLKPFNLATTGYIL